MTPPIILLFLLLHATSAVQLSDLAPTTEQLFYPQQIHNFPDGTVLVSAIGYEPLDYYPLHPILTIPDPADYYEESLILARVHPTNQTLVWATALTTINPRAAITADADGNAYVVAARSWDIDETYSHITAIKISFTGEKLYETVHTPPLSMSNYGFELPIYSFDSAHAAGPLTLLSDRLIIPAILEPQEDSRRAGFLQFSAATGEFLESRSFRTPRNADRFMDIDGLAAIVDRRRRVGGPVVCVLVRTDKYLVQCGRATGTLQPVTRIIDRKNARYFNGLVTTEANPPVNRPPSLFVSYQRVYNSTPRTGSPVPRHELVVSRLATSDLKRVNWATGRSGRRQPQPFVASLPEGDDHPAITVKGFQHMSESRSAALFFSTAHNLTSFRHPRGQAGRLNIRSGREIFTFEYWMLFINRRQQASAVLADSNPTDGGRDYSSMLYSGMAMSGNEKCARLFGELRTGVYSGPFYVYSIPNPYTSRDGEC